MPPREMRNVPAGTPQFRSSLKVRSHMGVGVFADMCIRSAVVTEEDHWVRSHTTIMDPVVVRLVASTPETGRG
jgi:hypothetical protein